MDYRIVEQTIFGILSEVYRCLERLNKLRGKYAMDLTPGLSSSSTPSGQVSQGTAPSLASAPTSTGLHNVDPLFSSPRVTAMLSRDTTIRQERSRAVSFFRKVNFGWSLSNDVSDRVKLEEALKTLKDLNDHLELILPSSGRSGNGVEVTGRLVALKMLSVAMEPTELRSIEEAMATRAGHTNLYQAIHTAAIVKAKRLEGGVSPSELDRVVLQVDMLLGPQGPSQGKSTRTLCKLQSDGSTVLVEGAQYPNSLPDADVQLLNKRIATLALLLKLAGHPYFKSLPGCHGYIRYSHTRFGLVYSLPDLADPIRGAVSLYSLLPTTSRRKLETVGMTKRSRTGQGAIDFSPLGSVSFFLSGGEIKLTVAELRNWP
ncbi:hypothetical protein N0V84_006003 [Fusarium piperis]|uniref:Prion-inhibition and propagation HeLo domain-containing protein n=1 Tax=Fusarium piperis TaxID=1435070 RepID=A0A9W8WCM4_9HYPO|nr:hypothetical protein N0V84_006003 [Fusarium piperis]